MDKSNSYMNQYLAILITGEQLLARDKNKFYKYKKIHLILKA